MLFHWFSVQLMSLKTDGWMTDIFFLGVFELAARVWGVHLFQSISNLKTGPSEVVALDNSDMTLEASDEVMVPEETVSDLHKNVEQIICKNEVRKWNYQESRDNYMELSTYLGTVPVNYMYEDLIPETLFANHNRFSRFVFPRAP